MEKEKVKGNEKAINYIVHFGVVSGRMCQHTISNKRRSALRDKVKGRITAMSELICETINAEWEYDHTRPTMKCASIHGKNPHIHLKVHPNTKRTKRKK
jgi:hypothetical protein